MQITISCCLNNKNPHRKASQAVQKVAVVRSIAAAAQDGRFPLN